MGSGMGVWSAGLLLVVMLLADWRSAHRPRPRETVVRTDLPGKTARAQSNVDHGRVLRADRAPIGRVDVESDAIEQDASDPDTIQYERRQMRLVLANEIRSIDKELAELRSEALVASGSARDAKLSELGDALEWQRRLRGDLEAERRVGNDVWSAFRTHVERELEEEHPANVAASSDKSLGI